MTTEENELFDENESFEELFNQSIDKTENFLPGDKVTGTIVLISEDTAFVNISGKSEAIIDKNEFIDEQGNDLFKTGDKIEAYVVSTKGGEILLTSEIGKGKLSPEVLKIAYENQIPIKGTVNSIVKGGFRIKISEYTAFCPFSHLDLRLSEPKENYLDQTFSFVIIKSEGIRNLVVSRRVLLEAENLKKIELLKQSLKEGDVIEGQILSIQNFGIFIEIGGTEALIPKSEISRSRYADTTNFPIGEKIKAQIISIDWEKKKIAASLKKLQNDPWEEIEKYNEGDTVSGFITNMIPQGAFMEIEPGLEGFIHVSKMSLTKRVSKPQDILEKKQKISAQIIGINKKDRKISLELLTDEENPWQIDKDSIIKQTHSAIIEGSVKAGIRIRLENGLPGFIPFRELLNNSSESLVSNYPSGKNITVSIKEFNPKDKKLIASEKGAEALTDKKSFDEFQKKQNEEQGGSSLGALFKDKFSDIQNKIK